MLNTTNLSFLNSTINEFMNKTINSTNSTSNANTSSRQPEINYVTPYSLDITMRVVYIVVFLVGVIGNIMVCYIICKRYPGSKRRSIHNFTLNLAFADLLVLFLYLPSQYLLVINQMKWKIGDVMCRFTYSIVPLSIYASIATLMAISRDRYYAVTKPMSSLERPSTRPILICVWVVSFILTIPLSLVSRLHGGYCSEKWPSLFIENFYWIFAFCIQFAFPVLILAIAHAMIIIHLKRLTLPTQDHRRARAVERRRQQKKLIVMSVVLVVVYVICVLPQHVVFFWMSYGDLQKQPYGMYIFQISNLMLILNSALNPVVYGTLNNDIKKGIIGVFKRGNHARSTFKNTFYMKTMTSFYNSPLIRDNTTRMKESENGDTVTRSLKCKQKSQLRRGLTLPNTRYRRNVNCLYEEDTSFITKQVDH
eukprot:Seg2067.1 transcript_id=Seg2067.1/GoldUCD/mRNA.D3Y31 product="Neuropeptide SIFamide receptor" protein_id=Seg2067.1/GoldUCD/D3Y31